MGYFFGYNCLYIIKADQLLYANKGTCYSTNIKGLPKHSPRLYEPLKQLSGGQPSGRLRTIKPSSGSLSAGLG
jgi:hypothetical protein